MTTSEIVGENLEIGRVLGKGGQATVRLGTDRNGKRFAVKIYDMS